VDPIRYFNRHTDELETEDIYGEAWLRCAYETLPGRAMLHLLVKRRLFSRLYGRRMSSPASRRQIEPFIREYGLDPDDFADPLDSFGSFNAFFSRKLKPSARPLAAAPLVFPADGRHLGFAKASAIDSVFVKGQRFDLAALLGSDDLAAKYADGPLVLSRLCPVDYHRFHFPAAGTPGPPRLINGPLYSVSPIALRRNLSYLWQNKRVLTPLVTASLGTILLIDIGATNVGSIKQTFTPDQPVEKGEEKGYFEFGGSSLITLFEPGTITLAADLLEHSARQTELFAMMGSEVGQVCNLSR
jgi:phosphatidylserine decarboxylase